MNTGTPELIVRVFFIVVMTCDTFIGKENSNPLLIFELSHLPEAQ